VKSNETQGPRWFRQKGLRTCGHGWGPKKKSTGGTHSKIMIKKALEWGNLKVGTGGIEEQTGPATFLEGKKDRAHFTLKYFWHSVGGGAKTTGREGSKIGGKNSHRRLMKGIANYYSRKPLGDAAVDGRKGQSQHGNNDYKTGWEDRSGEP